MASAPDKRVKTGVFSPYGTRVCPNWLRECPIGGGIAENWSQQKEMIWFLIFNVSVVVNLV